MSVREVALELTALICHEKEDKNVDEILALYKKCYQKVMEVEAGELLS